MPRRPYLSAVFSPAMPIQPEFWLRSRRAVLSWTNRANPTRSFLLKTKRAASAFFETFNVFVWRARKRGKEKSYFFGRRSGYSVSSTTRSAPAVLSETVKQPEYLRNLLTELIFLPGFVDSEIRVEGLNEYFVTNNRLWYGRELYFRTLDYLPTYRQVRTSTSER